MDLTTATGFVTTYAFTDGVRCLLGGGGAIVLPAKVRLDGLTPTQTDAIRALNAGALAVPADADADIRQLVDRLIDLGALRLRVSVRSGDPAQDRNLYSLIPFRRPPGPRPAVSVDTPLLSRFTILRRTDLGIVAENPASWCDVVFHDAAALTAITAPVPGDTLPDDVTARLFADLSWAAMVSTAGVEEREFATRSWSPHELWFHRRSTVGNRATSWSEFGPTRWAESTFDPLPARRPAYPGAVVDLPRPDLDALRLADRTLTEVVEDRRSVRSFDDDHPITLAQLGELLYRSARTRDVRTIGQTRGIDEELPSRPHPSGGSLYEMELYAVVRTSDGLKPGMYHYDSFDHVLRHVADYDHPAIARLIAPAALTLSEGRQPQVLLIAAARVGRIMWTYEQMTYAVILKHVGVLTQNLYLTATAMGLGGVAQGYGDTSAFAELTGNDELVECNVGSFVVGTPAPGPTD
ncbi:SagB family peptide dehydrogenase [Gordonia sp. ABSL1-1]|uniref:SagB family peptide dehydrogenase n=1 Tax=Gordonia sp. ABSL1-1 TaxID=3053923 RepID=UPI002573CE96|nr:SagB family peptide dehydrogenase [Gordonia sp. ABSL1-1]MDL9938978.1 SagB family peptide dehydrogenase [Gordonia sp. ABSL1-1]